MSSIESGFLPFVGPLAKHSEAVETVCLAFLAAATLALLAAIVYVLLLAVLWLGSWSNSIPFHHFLRSESSRSILPELLPELLVVTAR